MAPAAGGDDSRPTPPQSGGAPGGPLRRRSAACSPTSSTGASRRSRAAEPQRDGSRSASASPARRWACRAARRSSTRTTSRASCGGISTSPPCRRSCAAAMLDRRITRLVKGANGEARFETIEDPEEVIKLAGRAGCLRPGERVRVPRGPAGGAGLGHAPGHRGGYRRAAGRGHPAGAPLQDDEHRLQAAGGVGAARGDEGRHRHRLRLGVPRLRPVRAHHDGLLRGPRPAGPPATS